MEIGVSLDSLWRAVIFLGVPFVLMVFYLQWHWAKTCNENIRVLVVQQGGGGSFQLAPKEGGSVSLTNPHNSTVRTWPINELTTIDVLYPGVGFVPAFLQKTIRLAIVHEGDWEPLLNRSPHMRKVASPDMVLALEAIAKEHANDKVGKELKILLDGVSTSPTREMIASPAVLGNLIQEKISELAVTVARDIVNPINEAIKKLGRQLNPTYVYIGLGLVIILQAFWIFKGLPAIGGTEEMADNVEKIMRALGVQ